MFILIKDQRKAPLLFSHYRPGKLDIKVTVFCCISRLQPKMSQYCHFLQYFTVNYAEFFYSVPNQRCSTQGIPLASCVLIKRKWAFPNEIQTPFEKTKQKHQYF